MNLKRLIHECNIQVLRALRKLIMERRGTL
jgi:hypothetical protein